MSRPAQQPVTDYLYLTGNAQAEGHLLRAGQEYDRQLSLLKQSGLACH